MTKEIESDDFENEINSSNKPVSIFFWVRSCDGCRKYKPVYDELSNHISEVRFLKMGMLKSIENLRLAESLGVEETPTTVIFCRGKKVGSIVGFREVEEAKEEINNILEKC
jgi:thioredoxin 1